MGRRRKFLLFGVVFFLSLATAVALIIGKLVSSRTIYDRPVPMQVEYAADHVKDAVLSAASFYQQKGRLPVSLQELFPHSLFTDIDGSWSDPFAKPVSLAVLERFRPLQFIVRDKTLTVYSVGPDRCDDLGIVAYDPTNGVSSRGDIIGLLRLP